MPNIGDIETRFGRHYTFVNPGPTQGPGTWRLSVPDEYPASGGGGTAGGTVYDFDGEPPVEVDMSPGVGTNPTIVTTSLDFIQLDSRQAP